MSGISHGQDGAGTDNAMTEVALALAMGFFSLMVLTLVSMGSGDTSDTSETGFDEVEFVVSKPASDTAPSASSNDRFVMFFKGHFFDRDGSEVTPSSISAPPGGRVILVVDPTSKLAAIINAKQQFSDQTVIVAEMTQDWIDALQRKEAAQ